MDPAKQPQAPRPGGSGVLMSIQALRGIATFVVILAHIQLYVAGKMNLPDLLPFNGVVGAAVDSFFVVSGFIMVYASERLFGQPGGTRIFFLRRLARILPMYWVTTTFVVIYLIATFGSLEAGGAPLSYVFASYFFIPTTRPDGWGTPVHGVAWTLNYEMFFYMLFGCFVFLSRRRILVVVIPIFIALVLFALAFGPFPNPWAFWSYALILEFVLGMVLALLYRDGLRIGAAAYWALLAGATAARGRAADPVLVGGARRLLPAERERAAVHLGLPDLPDRRRAGALAHARAHRSVLALLGLHRRRVLLGLSDPHADHRAAAPAARALHRARGCAVALCRPDGRARLRARHPGLRLSGEAAARLFPAQERGRPQEARRADGGDPRSE